MALSCPAFLMFLFLTLICSIGHPFLGDYVRLRQNPQWKKICTESNDQYVVFADIINKITRSGGKVKNLRASFTFYPEFFKIKIKILLNVNFKPLNLFFLSVCANIICDIHQLDANSGPKDHANQIQVKYG